MKKDEMIAAMNERLSDMTEEGVKAIYDVLIAFGDKERWNIHTTPERIAELDVMKEQKQKDEKQEAINAAEQRKVERDAFITEHAKLLNQINCVDIPARYDMSKEDFESLDYLNGSVAKCFPEYTWNMSTQFFQYGFNKGMRYAANKAKKESH